VSLLGSKLACSACDPHCNELPFPSDYIQHGSIQPLCRPRSAEPDLSDSPSVQSQRDHLGARAFTDDFIRKVISFGGYENSDKNDEDSSSIASSWGLAPSTARFAGSSMNVEQQPASEQLSRGPQLQLTATLASHRSNATSSCQSQRTLKRKEKDKALTTARSVHTDTQNW
jgi:hypothetical protein